MPFDFNDVSTDVGEAMRRIILLKDALQRSY